MVNATNWLGLPYQYCHETYDTKYTNENKNYQLGSSKYKRVNPHHQYIKWPKRSIWWYIKKRDNI